MGIFIIEAVASCLLFTILILILCTGKPENFINSWPPKVKERVQREKILEVGNERMSKAEIIRKLVGVIVFVILIGFLLKYVNKISTFLPAVLTSYGLWFVVDWWDAFFIDVLACKWKKMRIKGTEDWDTEYDNILFHIKESFIGMILGIPFSLLVGLFVVIIA